MIDDPVRAKRLRIQQASILAKRIGYGLFAIAIVGFFFALFTSFSEGWRILITACLFVGSVILAPAIVAGYAVNAAERDDREQGR